ncbi:hypothetical protein [Aquipuribacter hungaricus]|uniref:Bulb-type lectin domain-containing protein n=1 Tax=Aquipuribacter hungaricus TaxID=545624 RepID=A0ABV7WCM5_9MICO
MPTPTSRPALTAPTGTRPSGLARRLGPVLRLAVAAVLAAGSLVAVAAPASAAPVPPVPFATAPDAPSGYQGQVSCSGTETPGAAALRDLLKAAYGRANAGGTVRACGQGGTSEHKEGRAYDWMLNAGVPAEKALADSFLAWLVGPDAQGVAGGNARRLGVQYVIWNRQTWQSWNGKWKAYTGASPHTDHVHISLSWDGAYKRTSWWTGSAVTQVDRGPCVTHTGELAPAYTGPNYSPCPPPGTRGTLANGPGMYPGQALPTGAALTSPRGGMAAVMQADGNFVVYAPGSRPVWSTRTHGNPAARMVMQADGNLVVYASGNRPVWSSGTSANPSARLVLQDDGNLVVYRSDNRALWASGSRA